MTWILQSGIMAGAGVGDTLAQLPSIATSLRSAAAVVTQTNKSLNNKLQIKSLWGSPVTQAEIRALQRGQETGGAES